MRTRESDQWLYERMISPKNDPEIENRIEQSGLNEILLTIRKINMKNMKISEKLIKKCIETIKKHIQEKLPEYSEKQYQFLLHMVLEISGGIHANEQECEAVSTAMNSMIEMEDEDDLREKIKLANPEILQKLGIIIPDFKDVTQYIKMILQSANENEVFHKQKNFQTGRYVQFVKDITEKFREISLKSGFEPISLESLTPAIVKEGILNLDLRASNQPLMDFLDMLEKAEIKLDTNATIKSIQSYDHSRQPEKSIKKIERKLLKNNKFLRLINSFSKGIIDLDTRDIASKICNPKMDEDIQKAYENQIKNIRILRRMLARADIQNIEELKTLFNTVDQYLIRHRNIASNLKIREYIAYAFETMIHKLIFNGANFLPAERHERAKIILGLLRTTQSEETRFMLTKIMLQLEDIDYLDYENNPHAVEQSLELAEIIAGNKKIYESLGLSAPEVDTHKKGHVKELSPDPDQNQRIYKLESTDQELIFDAIMYYYDLLAEKISTKAKDMPKSELLTALQEVHDLSSRYFSDTPSPQKGYNRIGSEKILKGGLLAVIFKNFQFNLDEKMDQEILLHVASMMRDATLRARIHEAIIKKRLASKNFDGKLYMLFQDPRTRMSMTGDLKEAFIERTAQTQEEMRKIKKAIAEYIDIMTDVENVGAAVIFEKLNEYIGDKRRIFQILMKTGKSDKEIKNMIFEAVRRKSEMEDERGIMDEENIIETEIILKQLFHSNDMVRYAIVRNLLLGGKGLLMNMDDRLWLFNYFFEKHIKTTQTREEQEQSIIVRQILNVMCEALSPDMLYFGIAPIIQKSIARHPQREEGWAKIIRKLGYKDEETILETLRAVDALKKGEEVEIVGAHGKKEKITSQNDNAIILEATERILSGEENSTPISTPHATWKIHEFILELAKSLGSPGIRFLQIIGQYFELPGNLEKAFQDVYDSVKGQSKLTARETIVREWPEFEQECVRMVERIGGGSLMSVYECEMRDGSREVVKVLNPNALMQVKLTIEMLKNTFAILVQQDAEKYKMAETMIAEIEEWIREDIDYDHFIERDADFYAKHHGFSAPDHEYRLHIPKSKGIPGKGDNHYVKREERIQGQTLVRPEKLEGHDLKQITSLIAKNYIRQIMDGRVHADVHPGNFMVFTDSEGGKKVAVIDRNNFIELEPKDKMLLFTLQSKAGQPGKMITELLDYLRRDGREITSEQESRIQKSVGKNLKGKTEISDIIPSIMLAFRQEKIKVPLKLTLMVKNLNGLRHLVKKTGFQSIEQAINYSPEVENAVKEAE